jgi:putative redox protein
MIKAKIAQTKYRLEMQNGRHSFFVDEPVDVGGTDTAPSPDEYLEAALASCTAITLRMYANRKEWPIENIEVSVQLERKEGQSFFNRSIKLIGNIQPEEKQRLLQIAKACPVSKTLLGTSLIESTIE